MFNEPNTTQRTLAEYEQVYRLLDRELARARRARSRSGSWAATSSGRRSGRRRPSGSSTWRATWATCSMRGRCTSTGTSGTPTRSTSDSMPRCERSSATIPAEQRRPLYVTEFGVRGLRDLRGRAELRARLLAGRDGDVRDERCSAFQHAWFNIRAAQLGYSGTVKWDRLPGEVRRRHAGSLGRSGRGGRLAGATRLQRAAADDADDGSRGEAASSRSSRSAGADAREAADGVRLAGERHHDSRPPYGRAASISDDVARARSRTASAGSRRTRRSGSSSGTATARGGNIDGGFVDHRRDGVDPVLRPARRRLRPYERRRSSPCPGDACRNPTSAEELTRSHAPAARGRRCGRLRRRRHDVRRTRSQARSGTADRWLEGRAVHRRSGRTSCRGTTPGSGPGRRRGASRTTSQVEIDHEPYTQLPALAAAEVKAAARTRHLRLPLAAGALRGPGHQPRARSSARSRARSARTASSASEARTTRRRRSTSASRTTSCRRRSIWRHDLWNSIGESPATWDHVRAGGTCAEGARASDRDRPGERASTRTSPCSRS